MPVTTDNQPQVPASAPSADAIWTTGTLTLIAIGVVLALLLIWWGARLKRQRRAAEREVLDRQEDRHDGAAPASADGDAALVSVPPPVAPAPPPIAPDDAPVAVTAPRVTAANVATPAPPAASAGTGEASPPAPVASPPPAADDDLTLLKGVGPKLAARLAELGVTRFAQIAALSPADAEALDAQLGSFQGRMARDRWIEQARYLAANDRAGFEAAFGKL